MHNHTQHASAEEQWKQTDSSLRCFYSGLNRNTRKMKSAEKNTGPVYCNFFVRPPNFINSFVDFENLTVTRNHVYHNIE